MPNLFDVSTNKNGFFIFGGESSEDYGLVISEAPKFESATRKTKVFDVPGRNGAMLIQQDAWNDVPRQYKAWIAADKASELPEKVAAVAAWLNSQKGYIRLEDSFEPDLFRLAYYSGGNDFSNNMLQYGEAEINFTCRAERFQKSGEIASPLISGVPIYNATRFEAKPLIHIEGTGAVTLTLGGKVIVATITDYINIDCERMNAYRLPAENMNNKITGTFPTLAPGNNGVAITGSVSKASIIPRWFTVL